jgi:hypothetical protein
LKERSKLASGTEAPAERSTLIKLTDVRGNDCWVRANQIKVIFVGPPLSRGNKRRPTRIRLIGDDGHFFIDVLETPAEVEQLMRSVGNSK